MKKHINHFKTVFIRFKKYGIVINLITYTFGTSEVEFLGLRIGGAGISPFLTKTKAIIEFPVPTNMKPLRQFLGTVNFYLHFIPNCASILKPLIISFFSTKADQYPEEIQHFWERIVCRLCRCSSLQAFPGRGDDFIFSPTTNHLMVRTGRIRRSILQDR